MVQDVQAIDAAVAGVAKAWSLTEAEAAALKLALKGGRLDEYDSQRVAHFLDIYEWLDAISRNLGGPAAWLRGTPKDERSNLEKILSGSADDLSEVHRELSNHAFFGFSRS